jgi:hypothetical protein
MNTARSCLWRADKVKVSPGRAFHCHHSVVMVAPGGDGDTAVGSSITNPLMRGLGTKPLPRSHPNCIGYSMLSTLTPPSPKNAKSPIDQLLNRTDPTDINAGPERLPVPSEHPPNWLWPDPAMEASLSQPAAFTMVVRGEDHHAGGGMVAQKLLWLQYCTVTLSVAAIIVLSFHHHETPMFLSYNFPTVSFSFIIHIMLEQP